MNGGMPSRTSPLPQRKPTPVGPHILWLLATRKSHPSSVTSTGMCGTLWHASSSSSAPHSSQISLTSATLTSPPMVLLTCATDTSFVLGPAFALRSSTSMRPSGVSPAKRSTHPVRFATICHGTTLAWCSSTESTTSSPSERFSTPQVNATRLIASVALRVKTTSRSDGAPTKDATLARAASYCAVASAERWCTPRWTLELLVA
mmetsp:Transcript_7255/g.25573  ORF Transcript_7255/g.25573 Transcript_7255/m.25573 type:complete len:204 (-) Transcript_7255:229-840(-)